MVPSVPPLRGNRPDAIGDRSAIDLGERCCQCKRVAYMCEREGSDSICGFMCRWCVGLMDGDYRRAKCSDSSTSL